MISRSQYNPDKWYTKRDYKHTRLKTARNRMIRNHYTVTKIRENHDAKHVLRWVFEYQLPKNVSPVPSLPKEYVK